LNPGFLERHFGGVLAALIVLATLSRAALLAEFIERNPFSEVLYSDAWVYWFMSAQKAGGQWIEQTPFLQAPLYPNLLAIGRYFGFSIGVIAAIQALANLAAIYLLAVAGRRRFGAATGLLAAVLMALSLELTIATTQILATTLQVLMVTVALWSWTRCSDRRTVGDAALTGGCLGLLTLSWSPGQLLLPVFAIWLLAYLRPWRYAFSAVAVGLGCALLVLSPATIHNYYVDHDFSLVSANGGINLYFGNNPNAQGIIAPAPGIRVERESMFADAARIYAEETGGTGSWADMDRFYRDKALDYWHSDPLNAATLFVRKLYWVLVSTDYDNTGIISLYRELGLFGFGWLTPLQVPWLMGLGFLGLLSLSRQPLRYGPELVLVTLPVLMCVVFYFSGRYRLPMLPPLCVVAALAVTRWRQMGPRPFRWFVALTPALLLVIEAQLRLVDVHCTGRSAGDRR
jgi:4-amino-4-deoxy-L-arabinose transferase-like glycosyltransferase